MCDKIDSLIHLRPLSTIGALFTGNAPTVTSRRVSVVRSNIVCDLLAFPGDVTGDGGNFCVEFSSLLFLVKS